MRYFIHLAYRGTEYRGWQKQVTTDQCIQNVLEKAFLKMTGIPTVISGCGRTDVGVHAKQYFAHVDIDFDWIYDPAERINRILPDDISVFEFIRVDDRNHSRYDAISRTYEYHIHFEKDPYLAPLSLHTYQKLDYHLLDQGMNFIKQTEDFRYACLTPDRLKNTRCKIFDAGRILLHDENRLILTFTANRFLKSMIRMLVGRLLALSSSKISLTTFENIMTGQEVLKYPLMAYPHGLHLSKVVYPYLQRDLRVKF